MSIYLAACIGEEKEDAGFVGRDGYLRPSQRMTEKLIILYSVARFTPLCVWCQLSFAESSCKETFTAAIVLIGVSRWSISA